MLSVITGLSGGEYDTIFLNRHNAVDSWLNHVFDIDTNSFEENKSANHIDYQIVLTNQFLGCLPFVSDFFLTTCLLDPKSARCPHGLEEIHFENRQQRLLL